MSMRSPFFGARTNARAASGWAGRRLFLNILGDRRERWVVLSGREVWGLDLAFIKEGAQLVVLRQHPVLVGTFAARPLVPTLGKHDRLELGTTLERV